jgi:DNA-binding response OmpR family regulator
MKRYPMAEVTAGIPVPANLTKTELAIFRYLAERANTRVSRDAILGVMKGRSAHTIDSHIMSIRRKSEQDGSSARIETLIGFGFVLHT